MPPSILTIDAISKCYRTYRSEFQRIATWFGYSPRPQEEQQILHQIDLRISAGETVAIVGQNGAGKSTLLKIIAGTLKPTGGSVSVAGKIAAILELGMGFHPHLTGRQNVYHAAGLLGYSRPEIDQVMDGIEAFAEIGEYFDQEVRTYSSGMQMRLAFSVVTMYRPEILIIDEALSVGDAYFQHKSFNLIRQFREQGTTLLFASHDRAAIQSICTRAVLLHQGRIIKDDRPEVVMDFYNALISDRENSQIQQVSDPQGNVQTSSGSREATFGRVFLTDVDDRNLEVVAVGQDVVLTLEVEVVNNISELVAGFVIRDRLGIDVFGSNSHHLGQVKHRIAAGTKLLYRYRFPMNLGEGAYSISVALHAGYAHVSANYQWLDRALIFEVMNINKQQYTGLAWLPTQLTIATASV